MKRILTMAALGMAVAVAAPASAVTVTVGTPDVGPAAPSGFASYTSIDFNTGAAPGFTGGGVESGSYPGAYSQPNADPSKYYVVGPSTSTPATLAAAGFNKFSLYWGSVDSFNTITFLGLGATYTGSSLVAGLPINGGSDGLISRTVTFDFSDAEAAQITGVQFKSTGQNAFEFDNVVYGAAVPEPATWAIMMFGIGLAGASLRSKRKSAGTLVRA